MTKIFLGFNCNCFTNRYDEPEEWTRICAELGIKYVMFNIDLIEPYWPWDVQKKLCDRRTLLRTERNSGATTVTPRPIVSASLGASRSSNVVEHRTDGMLTDNLFWYSLSYGNGSY